MAFQDSRKLAPIAFFVYNRPEHTKRTLEALAANRLAPTSSLIIFSDGAKNEKAIPLVEQVRQYMEQIDGFASVTVVKRDKNWGLANSIIDGVTQVIEQYGKIIVLEDDLVTSKFFLEFMNDGLCLYEDNKEVCSINGVMYPLNVSSMPSSCFLPFSDSWGWGTWKRAWDNFNGDALFLLKEIKKRKLCEKFDLDSSVPHLRLLKKQIKGEIDSWWIRWQATNFLLDLKGLFSGQNFVQNIGYDGSGRHCGQVENPELYVAPLSKFYNKIEAIPVEIDPVVFEYIKEYYRCVYPKQNPCFEFVADLARKVLPEKVLSLIRKYRRKKRQYAIQ
jgi:hypothetical protein